MRQAKIKRFNTLDYTGSDQYDLHEPLLFWSQP
mgnify:CR=1 FL=1